MGFHISFYTNRKHIRIKELSSVCCRHRSLHRNAALASGAVSPWWLLSGCGAGNTLHLAFLCSICLAKHPGRRAEQQLLLFAVRYSIVWKHYTSSAADGYSGASHLAWRATPSRSPGSIERGKASPGEEREGWHRPVPSWQPEHKGRQAGTVPRPGSGGCVDSAGKCRHAAGQGPGLAAP